MQPAEALAVLSGLPLRTLKRLALERACYLSLRHYVRRAWEIHHANEPLQWGWYIGVVCDHLQAAAEGRLKHPNLIINMPPGLAKSYVASVCFPAWVHAREPWKRFVCSTASEKNLYRDSRKTQEQIQSAWYQAAFRRGRWGLKRGATAYGAWQTTDHGERVSVTPKQALTGAKSHIGINDDILDVRDAYPGSSEMARLPGWLDQTQSTRLVHATSPNILMMQRLSEADPTAHWLRQGPCEHVCLPAEYDGVRRSTSLGEYDPRTEKGELLAPLRYDVPALDLWRKKLGPAGYSAQFQQAPTPSTGLMFDAGWIQYWVELPDKFDYTFTSWDTGWKEGRRNDYTTGQLWGVRGQGAWLLAQRRGVWNPDRMITEVQALAKLAPAAVGHAIEAKAAGPYLLRQLEGLVPKLQPVDPGDRSKPGRAAAVVPFWAAGRVWLPHPHEVTQSPWHPGGYEWVSRDFVPELLGFPLTGHDDQVDTMSQALLLAFAEEGLDLPALSY